MKGINNGFVFDTEKATELVTLKDCEYGNGGIYRTSKGRYFLTNDSDDSEQPITQIKDLVEVEGVIGEWKDLGSGEVIIHFEEFEVG